MKLSVRFMLLLLLCVVAFTSSEAQWRELYATYDNEVNGTGSNTISVGVIHENTFVALISNSTECFMVPYVNADSALGRKNYFGYASGATGVFQSWTDGVFDVIPLTNATKIVARPDSTLYVANNDANHNILLFKFNGDTVVPVNAYRTETGTNGICGLDVDDSGYVYVCNDTTTGQTADVKIFKPVAHWSAAHTDAPVVTIDLPDGIYKGITASPDGKQLFVSDYTNRRVLKYTGSRTSGYTEVTSFNFAINDTIAATGRLPGPIQLKLMMPNNILFVTSHIWKGASGAYSYGKIFLVNPNTGARISEDTLISVIDVAAWNLKMLGSYTGRGDGTASGAASGYTSTYDVTFDEKGFLYSQSYYGWTIEKWEYSGTLPTITSVTELSSEIPEGFVLQQNYPNPFNPSTTLEYTLARSGQVTLKIYNVLGQEVATLIDGQQSAGVFRAVWDAHGLPSGAYYAVLQTGDVRLVRSMMLLK